MSEYQKCPVCDGHGVTPYPPGIAAGQQWGGTSSGPWPCHRCSGQGTIIKPEPEPIPLDLLKLTLT